MNVDHLAPTEFYIAGRTAVATAEELIAHFGDQAAVHASALASRSRDLGNAIGFARWRGIERLILALQSHTRVGALH
jgi:hypothetical protein